MINIFRFAKNSIKTKIPIVLLCTRFSCLFMGGREKAIFHNLAGHEVVFTITTTTAAAIIISSSSSSNVI